jgi:hypothetical protein
LIPSNVVVDLQARLPGGLSPSDMAIFQAVREAIPDANDREPAEVLEYVLSALRAYDAKTIDHTENPPELSSKKPA